MKATIHHGWPEVHALITTDIDITMAAPFAAFTNDRRTS